MIISNNPLRQKKKRNFSSNYQQTHGVKFEALNYKSLLNKDFLQEVYLDYFTITLNKTKGLYDHDFRNLKSQVHKTLPDFNFVLKKKGPFEKEEIPKPPDLLTKWHQQKKVNENKEIPVTFVSTRKFEGYIVPFPGRMGHWLLLSFMEKSIDFPATAGSTRLDFKICVGLFQDRSPMKYEDAVEFLWDFYQLQTDYFTKKFPKRKKI